MKPDGQYEGYLTADNRRSRSVGSNMKKDVQDKSARRKSRSLNRNKSGKNVTIKAVSPVRKTTPTNERRMPPPGDFGYITPKVRSLLKVKKADVANPVPTA